MNPIQAATLLVNQTVKVADELEKRAAALPKPVDDTLVKEATDALISNGWLTEAQRDQAIKTLKDPVQALQTLKNLAGTAKESLDQYAGDSRLNTGTPTGEVTQKRASYSDESEADRKFREKISSYRKN